VFQSNQRKILELETKQRLIESSFRNIKQLRQELTSVNKDAQFTNEKIHSFLSTFIPDYRLIKEPPSQRNQRPKEKEDKCLDANNNSAKEDKPKVIIAFDFISSEEEDIEESSNKQRLPIPSVSYEWSDCKPVISVPTYLPRLGKHLHTGCPITYGAVSIG
jgi:hypothetical protein